MGVARAYPCAGLNERARASRRDREMECERASVRVCESEDERASVSRIFAPRRRSRTWESFKAGDERAERAEEPSKPRIRTFQGGLRP
eukprot:6019046-Pleurochrysis_carterae.AAC.1